PSRLRLRLRMWLVALVLGVRRARPVPVGVAILGVLTLLWFVPMVALTGGLGRYLAASAQLADSVVRPTSIVAGPFETTLRMSRYLVGAGLGAVRAVAPVVLAVSVCPGVR